MTSAVLADLTEKAWQGQVLELAGMFGWDHYFTYRSKRSPAGYPDLTCWRERVIWLELKREGGKLSAEQRRVIRGLLDAGAECYVVRPSDLDALAKVLAWRSPLGIGRPLIGEPLRERAREECGA